MKNKRKHRNTLILSLMLFTYVFSLSIGYAFFNEALTINGVASTVEYYAGTTLPTTAVVLDTTNNRYYTQDTTKNGLNFGDETWSGDTYTLHITKSWATSGGESTTNYSISFTNPTVLPYTDGTVSTEITSNTGSMLKDATTTISTTTKV